MPRCHLLLHELMSNISQEPNECVRKVWRYDLYGDPKNPLVPCSKADKIDKKNKAFFGVGSGLLLLSSGYLIWVCSRTNFCSFRRAPANQEVNGNAVRDPHVTPAVQAAPVAQPAPANQDMIELVDNALHSSAVNPMHVGTLAHVRARSLPTDDALLYVRHASIDAVERR